MLHYLDPNPNGHPGVLLLHGLGADATSWTLQLAPLAEAGFRPLALDAPGFGKSPYDGHGWGIQRVVDETAALLRELKTESVHVVGISMGGIIAQQLAFDHPELVEKLVLVNTFSVLRPRTVSRWIYFRLRLLMVQTVGVPRQAKLVARRIFPKPDQEFMRQQLIASISQADPRAYRLAMGSLKNFNSSNKLSTLRMPVLVISGGSDTTVDIQDQKILAQGISGARHVIIPGGGHGVSVDSYETFNRELITFLSSPS
jgi:pimeloyl-ACP methyl ester carboxylesterase